MLFALRIIIFLISFCSSIAVSHCQAPNELPFLVVGDWGDDINNQLPVAYSMAWWAQQNNPEFIFSTGDNFYPDGVSSTTDPQWNEKWVNVYNNDSLKDLQWYITVGNHDYFTGNAELNQVTYHYEVTSRWGLPDLWYSFTRQAGSVEVLFVAIDTIAMRENPDRHAEQLIWLENVLSTSTSYWKIVVGHFNVFSVGQYGPVLTDMVDTFLPIFERYQIDIYVCGHDHNLQHLSPIGDGGIDYIITGAGGRALYGDNSAYEKTLRDVYGIELNAFHEQHGYTVFHITETGIRFDHYGKDNQQLYSFTRTK